MSGGYSYTTLSADRDLPVRVTVAFYLDDAAWLRVSGVGTDRPHLGVSYGDVSVTIGPVPGEVTGQDARVARRLADLAAEYAADVERLSKAPKSGAATEAAGVPAA
jgi:hypothetical protein